MNNVVVAALFSCVVAATAMGASAHWEAQKDAGRIDGFLAAQKLLIHPHAPPGPARKPHKRGEWIV